MPSRQRVERGDILKAVTDALGRLACVHAVWEGGAVSHGALDEWSDIDLNVDADDGSAPRVMRAVERALRSLSGIDIAYPIPLPPRHDYAQAFYRVSGASPYRLLDLAVFRHSAADKFLTPEIHGAPVFYLNKRGALRPTAFDERTHVERMGRRLERLKLRYRVFSCFLEKELRRGNTLEAIYHYQRILLDTLLEVLKMRHSPARFDFGVRYVHRELPAPVLKRLAELSFVKDAADLRAKARRAERWLQHAMDEVDLRGIERSLAAGRSGPRRRAGAVSRSRRAKRR